jgi:hypothetical protein
LNKISLSFRGNGIVLCKHGFTADEWLSIEKKAENLNESVDYCWFQSNFHTNSLNGANADWNEISPIFSSRGLIIDYKGIIEIKLNGKRISKINASALEQDNLLFDIYNVNLKKAPSNLADFPIHTTVIETSIGLIGKMNFTLPEKFIPELLAFNLTKNEFPNYTIIESITYDGIEYKPEMEESLITGQFLLK